VRVDAQVDTARAQCLGDPGEHQVGPSLVVHRVERRDEVEPADLGEASRVAVLESRVRKAFAVGLQAGRGDPRWGKVEAGESRTRERAGHQVDGVAGSASAWNLGNAEYGTPPWRKQSMI
jgi:hypothetical protein